MPSLFLDGLPPEEPAAEDTNPGLRLEQTVPPPSSRQACAPSGPQPSRPGPKPSRLRPARASSKASAPKPSDERLDEAPLEQEDMAPPWPSEKAQKGEFNEADMLLNSLKTDFLALPGSDKLMIVGALGMVLSCFFPWKTLEYSGEVLGFLSWGVLIVPMAIGSVVGMLWRNRSYEAFPLLPWLLQGLSGLMAVVFCLVLAKMFWVSKPASALPEALIESSTPSLGLVLGLIFAVINLTGTGFGFKTTDGKKTPG